MEDRNIKNAFEKMKASDEQIDKIWKNIEQEMQQEPAQKIRRFPIVKHMLRVAAFAIVIISSGAGIDAATGGELLSKLKAVIAVEQGDQSVVSITENMQQRGIDVYAPDIEYIDDTYIVFGNQRGVTVYNHKKGKIDGTIDTQKIGCIYFNSDEYMTHIVKEGNKLILFNSKNQVPYGSYYKYFIGDDCAEYSVKETGEYKEELQKFYELWESKQKEYSDTFELFSEVASLNEYVTEKDGSYSCRTIRWRNKMGNLVNSYLTVDEKGYYINTYNEEKELIDKVEIVLEDKETQITEAILPTFVYTGTDTAVAAIWDSYRDDVLASTEMGEVLIPAFIIVKKVEKEDELLVFGNFWTHGFVLNGKMLEVSSGGDEPACFHLKPLENGYEVMSIEKAEDGSDFDESIKAFTKGYPEVYKKLINGQEGREDAIREYLRMYVENNQLDIQYYKEFGWDPVKIF